MSMFGTVTIGKRRNFRNWVVDYRLILIEVRFHFSRLLGQGAEIISGKGTLNHI